MLTGSLSFLAVLQRASCLQPRGCGTRAEGLKAVFSLPCSAVTHRVGCWASGLLLGKRVGERAAGRVGGLAGRWREAWAAQRSAPKGTAPASCLPRKPGCNQLATMPQNEKIRSSTTSSAREEEEGS